MTYREAPIRAPIDPPWGQKRNIGRKIAYTLFGAGGLGAVALLALGDPALAIVAALSSSGMGLSFLFGGGGQPGILEGRADPGGPEEPLRRAGLQPVGWTEWRAERDGFPVRVLYSALTARVRIDVALGSAPPFMLEIQTPPTQASTEVIDGLWVLSDQIDIVRPIVRAARRGVQDLPPEFATKLDGRVLRCWINRNHGGPSGYETVIGALDLSLGLARSMRDVGLGLAPFLRV